MVDRIKLWLIVIISISTLITIFVGMYYIYFSKKFKNRMEDISNAGEELSPKQFFELRERRDRHGLTTLRRRYGREGVYIIHNKDKDMYYVGQGNNFTERVNSHFTGSGNGDVYADYKYGDEFTIRLLYLSRTEYDSLNDLERDMITHYNAFHKGYNKTRGNR